MRWTAWTKAPAARIGSSPSWLEDEVDDALEGARLAEQPGGAEQHGGMAVVTAGVHHPLVSRRIGQAGLLHHRKRVQFGAKTDGACARAAAQDTHNPGAADPLMYLVEAEGAQFLNNETRRFVLIESEFGIGVDVVAPGYDLWRQRGDRVIMQHDAFLSADKERFDPESGLESRTTGVLNQIDRSRDERRARDRDQDILAPSLLS